MPANGRLTYGAIGLLAGALPLCGCGISTSPNYLAHADANGLVVVGKIGTVDKANHIKKAEVNYYPSDEIVGDNVEFAHTVAQQQFDCIAGKSRVTTAFGVAKNGKRTVDDHPDIAWKAASEDSVGSRMLEIVCHPETVSGQGSWLSPDILFKKYQRES